MEAELAAAEEVQIVALYKQGFSVEEISKTQGRSTRAIRAVLYRVGMYSVPYITVGF